MLVLKFNFVVLKTLFLLVMNVLQLHDTEVMNLMIMFSFHNQDKPNSNIRRHELNLKMQQLQKVRPYKIFIFKLVISGRLAFYRYIVTWMYQDLFHFVTQIALSKGPCLVGARNVKVWKISVQKMILGLEFLKHVHRKMYEGRTKESEQRMKNNSADLFAFSIMYNNTQFHPHSQNKTVYILDGKGRFISLTIAPHADVFSGAHLSYLPTNTCSAENNIPFPLFYSRGKWPINSFEISIDWLNMTHKLLVV